MSHNPLKLKHIDYASLLDAKGLDALDQRFLDTLPSALRAKLLSYRAGARYDSELILHCAPLLESFIADLFNIEPQVEALKLSTQSHDPIFVFKKWYVQREARRHLKDADTYPAFSTLDKLIHNDSSEATEDRELRIAILGKQYLTDPVNYALEIEQLIKWCVQALCDPDGQAVVKNWASFKLPARLDYENLVPTDNLTLRHRDGFDLTDPRMNAREILNEVNYCVYCHEKEGDFCSKGFPLKKSEPEQGLKINPLDEILTGCPLDEKVSEMMVLKKAGFSIAPFAVVMIDNPMCPATGHRICNDCMKACVYQKQDPVDIPQVETAVLTDVLRLPWGVELYDLLTRWNPLRQTQYVMQPYNGFKNLIVGMGPAGFTLAHHLTMEGCAVVGVDGLKIERLNNDWINQPIYRFEDLKESLDDRLVAGFGGVAEYGITARWDKNFLKLIYLTLVRRKHFQIFGCVRFGGTLKIEDAWELGFDHLSIAVGAGLPSALTIPNSMVPGMRQANDVLMALQLTGAAKKENLSNLQIRLPAVVIGGGLTAIDTATEIQAYYIRQVEKMYFQYQNLKQKPTLSAQENEVLDEFLEHARAINIERAQAQKEKRLPDLHALIRQWGGVTIAYRRRMQDSPAYKRNHEELKKALEEGVLYLENLNPTSVCVDKFGSAEFLMCGEQKLPARSILVATGSKPNIAYEFEHRGTFRRSGQDYDTFDFDQGQLVEVGKKTHIKESGIGIFTSYEQLGKTVSFLGDAHPQFHGSVVKAIASSLKAYPKIMQVLNKQNPDKTSYAVFRERMKSLFTAILLDIKHHAPHAIELKIKAPQACKHYLPGHFYRLQTFESAGDMHTDAIVAVAMGADKAKGELTLLITDKTVSARLIATLKIGHPIALMGPAGVRTKIPHDNETILIIGEALSIARVCAIGQAMREAGNRVIYVGLFKDPEELHCQNKIEASTDQIVWISQTGQIEKQRMQDISMTGDALSLLATHGETLALAQVNRVLIHASVDFLRAFQHADKSYLNNPAVIASVYGPMQCMLKGVCAQCLQWQINPKTGVRTKAVFACSWQDQPLEVVDLEHLENRSMQGRLLEKLNAAWLNPL